MQQNLRKKIYVERKSGMNSAASDLVSELRSGLHLSNLRNVRLIALYEISGLTDQELDEAAPGIFYEETLDTAFREFAYLGLCIAREYLPGQFDQRSDSGERCLRLVFPGRVLEVKRADLFLPEGDFSDTQISRMRKWLINPVDSREKDLNGWSLGEITPVPEPVEVLQGFRDAGDHILENIRKDRGLALSREDMKFIRDWFKKREDRDPTLAELKALDTYWSDHCRHTTFETELTSIEISPAGTGANSAAGAGSEREAFEGEARDINAALDQWHQARKICGREGLPLTLMDLATITAREARQSGLLEDWDVSEEINACTLKVEARINGRTEPWLLSFKNETHNHPTEIEPIGGASTCLGGAVRDPLSGRAYVHQALRVSGGADPRQDPSLTRKGKLPQRLIAHGAAEGYAGYGNQLGLATTVVREHYHPGYAAKRLECGAVMGASPASHVVREVPEEGDVVILVGGRTGRDGIGGATGSSVAHDGRSLARAGAEVQKGNPPEERKLQRLFRKSEAAALIRRCNDFGAGGVAVAVGELADGLDVDLDAVRVKYQGLNGLELALSESQERMAVVVRPEDVGSFITLASAENLEAVRVAVVTASRRLRMVWRGEEVINLSRDLLETRGVRRQAEARIVIGCDRGGKDADSAGGGRYRTAAGVTDDAMAGAGTPGAITPDAITPGAITPDANTPGANTPGANTPGANTPDANTPDANTPDANTPGANTPGANTPGANTPGANTPDADEPADGRLSAGMLSSGRLSAGMLSADAVKSALSSIQVASRRGLEERFDGSVGGGTVLAPRGGMRQLTPAEASVHLLPADGEVETASIMSVGFDPDLSSVSPFRGGQYALIEALARMTAAGGSWRKARFSLQEYFGRTDRGPESWGAPLAALLGALTVQRRWGLPAIGGKDSMSGSFEELDVPPTIIAFAAAAMEACRAVGAAIPAAGLTLVLVGRPAGAENLPESAAPDFDSLAAGWDWVERLGARGHLKASGSVGPGGWICKAVIMALGNGLGMELNQPGGAPFLPVYGNLIVATDLGTDELNAEAAAAGAFITILGHSIREPEIRWPGGKVGLEEAKEAWQAGFSGIWPEDKSGDSPVAPAHGGSGNRAVSEKNISTARPRVCIPVFPGTNGEDDARRAFGRWGAEPREHVFLEDDTASLARAIDNAQILYISGGFSAGDEPDGAGKYIAAVLRQPRVADSIRSLLERDGLVLGICNGFQALIKSGWLLNGEAGIPGPDDPTLTRNRIGRHVARVVRTVATGATSPWLSRISRGDVYSVPMSHGEGRFIAPQAVLDRLNAEGRIAFQYCSPDGRPSMTGEHNPNGSMMAVEGIVSPCGRILGKMGHSERWRAGTFIDVPGMDVEQPLIAGGVEWFG